VIALEVKAAERGYSHEEGEDKIELDSLIIIACCEKVFQPRDLIVQFIGPKGNAAKCNSFKTQYD
jgi:hypothetical protein